MQKWIVGLVVLAIIGAAAGGSSEDTGKSSDGANEQLISGGSDSPAIDEEPEPTPDPQVEVSYSGPRSARSDDVTLKGRVDPPDAGVRIGGEPVKVRGGRWSHPVRLTKRGDNRFKVTATRKGYDDFSDTFSVTRKLSAAERAEIRRERALARANARALESAQSYLSYSAFSKQGLYEQLRYEEFTESEARYAVDHVAADWKKQAVKSAKNYLSYSSFSKQGLIDQLIYEGFTPEEASYGADRAY